MRCFIPSIVLVVLVLSAGSVDAQLIVEDFDSQTTGSPPAWLWWNNGPSGTILVDETIFRGSTGKSVELVRTTFDNYTFGFGRNFDLPGLGEFKNLRLHAAHPVGEGSGGKGWRVLLAFEK